MQQSPLFSLAQQNRKIAWGFQWEELIIQGNCKTCRDVFCPNQNVTAFSCAHSQTACLILYLLSLNLRFRSQTVIVAFFSRNWTQNITKPKECYSYISKLWVMEFSSLMQAPSLMSCQNCQRNSPRSNAEAVHVIPPDYLGLMTNN